MINCKFYFQDNNPSIRRWCRLFQMEDNSFWNKTFQMEIGCLMPPCGLVLTVSVAQWWTGSTCTSTLDQPTSQARAIPTFFHFFMRDFLMVSRNVQCNLRMSVRHCTAAREINQPSWDWTSNTPIVSNTPIKFWIEVVVFSYLNIGFGLQFLDMKTCSLSCIH